jgi:hypothetical protein
MNNIFNYLKPQKKDSSDYESIAGKYSLDNDLSLLWYHSAGVDFRILDYFHFRMNRKIISIPDLYVFTDYDYGDIIRKKFIKNGTIFSDNTKKITIENTVRLIPEMKITDYFHPGYNTKSTAFYREQNFPVYLSDIKVETKGEEPYNAPLLYLVWEDTAFLKAFVLERNIGIKYFQKPREYGFGGCWTEMVFLLYFLGIMKTKYLFLEVDRNFAYSIEKIPALIKRDKLLKEKFMDENNYVPSLKFWDIAMQGTRYEHPELYNLFLVSATGSEITKNLTLEEKFHRITRTLRL